MATVNNPVVKNYAPTSPSLYFNQWWMLSRVMKKAGWKHGGSSDGSTKTTSLDPAQDKWNGAAGVGGITNAGAAAATIVAPSRGRALVQGLSSIVPADKGRFIVISGSGTGANNNAHQIEEVISATEVKIDARTFAVAAEASNCTWVIRDPTEETYPSGTLAAVSAWLLLIGPATVKIPFSSLPVGRFLRGENVVQATTGAEGELIGVVRTTGTAGYLVILPRLRGSSAPTTHYGWASGNVVTGDGSGATVTQSATASTFVIEVVFWKANNQTHGSCSFGSFDVTADSAEDFLTLKSAAGCTATVAPGGGGTGNAFPTHAWLGWGTNTSGSHDSLWRASTNMANAQIMAADCIEEQLRSADGSWLLTAANTSVAGTAHMIRGFQYMEDHEPGDLVPWVDIKHGNGIVLNTHTRTAVGPGGSGNEASNDRLPSGVSGVLAQGWLARGTAREKLIDLEYATLLLASGVRYAFRNGGIAHRHQSQDPLPFNLERVWFICADAPSISQNWKTIKGSPRWIRCITGGSLYSVYQDADVPEFTYIQLGIATAGSITPFVVGPWDGSADGVTA